MASTRRTLAEVFRLLAGELERSTGWRLGAALLTVVGASVLAAVAPLALKEMVDTVARSHAAGSPWSAASVLGPALLYLLALSTARILAEARPWLAGKAEQRLHVRVSQRAFAHLLNLPLGFHMESRSGALIQTLHQAISGIQLLLISLINSIAPVLIEVATVAVVLASLDQPALVGCFVLTGLAYLGVFAHGAPALQARSGAVSSASVSLHAVLTDSLLNCEAIKCFGAERGTLGRLSDAALKLEANWSRLYRQRARMGIGAATVFTLSVASSLVLAENAVRSGTLTVGGFVLANVYMLQMVRPLEALGNGARDVWQSIEWIRPLIDLLRQPAEGGQSHLPRSAAGSAKAEVATAATVQVSVDAPAVSFHNVRFGYVPGQIVLDGIDLDIAPGHTLAVVGVSGSGKSSLVRLLLSLYEPQHGQILVDGVSLASLHPGTVRTMTGLVPQDTVLFNDTIAANIAIGNPQATPQSIRCAARLALLQDFIDSLPEGFDTVVGERGLKLSGGERQRVAIARAVLKRPRIYVFDEATSMLDGESEAAVLRSLRQVSTGCTTLIIAHRLSSIRHAQAIAVLDRGRIAERGTHAQLLASGGIYARLWQLQNPVVAR